MGVPICARFMKTVLVGQRKKSRTLHQRKKKTGSKPSKTKPKGNPKRQVDSNETKVCFEYDKENTPETRDNSPNCDVLWICCDVDML